MSKLTSTLYLNLKTDRLAIRFVTYYWAAYNVKECELTVLTKYPFKVWMIYFEYILSNFNLISSRGDVMHKSSPLNREDDC